MGQTTNYHLPYPGSGDVADVPADIKNLCDVLDAILADLYTTKASTSITDALSATIAELRIAADASYSDVSYASSTGILTFTTNGGDTKTIDLPLELLVEYGTYDSTTKKIILTLANGDTIEIPVGDLVSDIYTKSEVNALLAQKASQADMTAAQGDIAANSQSISGLNTRVTELENTSGHVYGIRRKISNNSSSAWERVYDSVGKTASATKNGGTVTNVHDNLAPWSDIRTCNYDLTTKKIKAWIGDANFKFDGTNGDVYTYYPETYWKIYQENDYDYILLADYPKSGFFKIDDFFAGRYNGAVVDNVLHSYSGLVPTTGRNISQFRTLAKALGNKFSLLDWRYLVIQLLYLVEYADYNSQSCLGNGIQNRKYLQTLVAESNTNRAIVSSSSGYYVGQIIRIGTGDGGTQVADARKITAIENYSEGGVTGVALTFDGAAVNIAVGNYVCTMAQETGQCDSLGMKSGCLNNDGYHSVIYRGVENIFANIWQFVDGINIKDRVAYICKDHSEYVSDKFEDPYKALSYVNADTNGWAKVLGFDPDEPLFRFPTEVGGSSSTYMDDYYYQNTGNRVALVGCGFNGGANDGLWYWDFDTASSGAAWTVGCRVLIDNQ